MMISIDAIKDSAQISILLFETFQMGTRIRTDLRRYNSLANNTLKLEGAALSHVNIWPSKYPNLEDLQ